MHVSKQCKLWVFTSHAIFLRLLDAHVILYTATYIFHILLTTHTPQFGLNSNLLTSLLLSNIHVYGKTFYILP